MILFKEDWRYYPTAIIDYKTTNRSFVHLAQLYQAMGIENCAFPLALVNPALQGVDPHAPDLSQHTISQITTECELNPWYYFREVAKAPAESGGKDRPFEANRANISLYWSFFNHVFYLLIQPRQTGKSFSVDVLMCYLLLIKCKDTSINLLTKDETLRRKNIQRLKDIRSSLPEYLQHKRKDDANNGEQITVKALGNSYDTHVPQSSPKLAYKVGRGLTTAVLHADEPPFQANIEIALGSALGAMGAAVDLAKAAGAPYGVILTTTAGKKDDKDGGYVYKILQSAANWTERFMDALDEDALRDMVRKASRGKVVRIHGTFDHRQLGKSDEWLKGKLEEALQEGQDASRDFFNIWTSGTETSPFTVEQAEKIGASRKEPAFTEVDREDGYITRWYIPEHEIEHRMANSQIVLGMDPSEGSGGDDISAVLVDIDTLEVLAAGSYNETNMITFSKWVAKWFIRWPNLTGIIERRSTGSMMIDHLLLLLPQFGIDPFKRLFNTIVQDADEAPMRYKEISQPMGRRTYDIYTRYKKSFGFATSGAGLFSRTGLYGTVLQGAVKNSADRMNDVTLIDQTLGLVIKNNRVDHEIGRHDDSVIGWLLCHWLITQGKNLKHYGIDPLRVMSRVRKPVEMTRQEAWRSQEQHQLRYEIDNTYKALLREQDQYIQANLERKLQHLTSKLILEENEIFSVDELIRSVQETRKQQRRGNNQRQAQLMPDARPTSEVSYSEW